MNTNGEFSSDVYAVKNGTTVIADYAFYGCTSLTSITIPSSVSNINGLAFYDCTSLTGITVANGNETYMSEDGVLFNKDQTTLIFYPCGKAGTYNVPTSVTSIGDSAFYGCTSLTSIVISYGITSIGDYAFYECISLANVTISDSVTNIGIYAFSACTSLTNVEIGSGVTSIGKHVFYGCDSLTSVTIPDSVTSIGSEAFFHCTSLASIVILDSVTSIGSFAFDSCTSLTRVTIGSGVTSIGTAAFGSCPNLTEVTIPANVTEIGVFAFGGWYTSTIYTEDYGTYDGFVIYGYTGTAAEEYAAEYEFTFIALPNDTEDPCADGHTWDAGVVTIPATCTEDGEITYTCTVCGETKTEVISATGHSWDDGVVTIEATYTEDGEITYTCTVCGETKTEVIPAIGENPFTDVDETNYFYSAVLWAIENGITSGTSETTFSPYQEAERCQVVTFLWRAAGCPEVAEGTVNPFTDVDEDDYFYTAVLWAVEEGITSGTTETTFSPFAKCERCQVVTFLYRYFDEPEVTTSENPFTDVDTDDYFYNAVLWAVENSITSGTTETTFGPFVTCERCMVVTFLYRALVE